MSDIRVTAADTLTFEGRSYRCAIGKNGFTQGTRREGSHTTPQGRFALRQCWYRPDKMNPPRTVLPLRALTQNDGWCDDTGHPLYNRAVKLPFDGSHERLWREDNLYDIVVPLGFNDGPVTPGLGSAIFLHIASSDFSPTEGCVAIALPDMLALLARITSYTQMLIAA